MSEIECLNFPLEYLPCHVRVPAPVSQEEKDALWDFIRDGGFDRIPPRLAQCALEFAQGKVPLWVFPWTDEMPRPKMKAPAIPEVSDHAPQHPQLVE